MTRYLIQIALPLFGPLLVYILWLWYAKKRAEKYGNEPPAFTKGTAFVTIMIGAVLAAISLIALALLSGSEPSGGAYQSPRWEDGRVIGPEFSEEEPENVGDKYREQFKSE